MALKLVTPPGVEPVSLAEAKAHARIDHADEDTYVSGLIVAARRLAEARTGRSFISQTWRLTLDAFPPGDEICLARGPVQSVAYVKTFDADDIESILDPARYVVDGESRPPRIVRKPELSWPFVGRAAEGVEIQYVAGYGAAASDVPEELRQAILMLTAHFYEQREILSENRLYEAPGAIDALLAPYAPVRI
ncbi:MAG: head-tail connector protein [Pseudomonadota bacterium]